ncbi:medium-chain acyl-CoA ligase ACSF2, mitochondrial-like isoform X1 [Bacillus rossius redtenbacheri]|uniref:medium-chain acyl-CoA ligase ACSF2, mitochondrial-like isoform X1 n=1 Tax=Bacillus rossius redtenbacheri TaxID=93214 RepID=UPI002FDE8F4B
MAYYSRLAALGYKRPSYHRRPGSEPLLALTVGQLVDWAAEEYGHREAMVSVYEGTRWTYQEVRDQADRLAAGFRELGLAVGDMIALCGYNSTYHYLTALAAARAGLLLAKVDPSCQAPELLHCLRKVGARLLLAGNDYYPLVLSLAPELEHSVPGQLFSEALPSLTTLVLAGDQSQPGAYLLKDVQKMATSDGIKRIRDLQECIDPDNAVFIHYTSGTTGSPKAAVLSHHSAVNASKFLERCLNPERKIHKSLVQMQCCHVGATLNGVLAGLHGGIAVVFPSAKFDPCLSITTMEEERCSLLLGTPAMYVDLVNKVQELGVTLTQPQVALITGTIVSEVIARQIIKVLHLKRFVPLYGMSEGVPFFISGPEDTLEQSVQTTGRAAADIEVKVVDSSGTMVPVGTPGELWIRGYCLMRGYWNDEEKTKETITKDGWLKTGDRVILDEDGFCKVVGRIKDVIIRGSDNIFPREVEEFFLTHPDVADVQAFGVPDARWTEEVCVYIRQKPGSKIDERQLKSYCKGKVADFRIPRYIRFATEFPQNMVGKVDKKKMRQDFLQDNEFLKNNEALMNKFFEGNCDNKQNILQ